MKITFAAVLLVMTICGCPGPSPTVDAASEDAGLPEQMTRLRIVNGCGADMWVFYLIGAGGGTLTEPHQNLLAGGGYIDFAIPDEGLASTRFWAGLECDATGNNCRIGQSGGPSSEGFSCPPTGCAPPIDSKFEGTFGCLPSVPSAMCQTNPSAPTMTLPTTDSWDTSLVDGFTLPFRVRVLDDCTSGPMNGEIDCSMLSPSECPVTEDLSTGGMFPVYMSLDLVATNPADMRSAGCYSDCGRLTFSEWGQTPALMPGDAAALAYCCPTPPVSPDTCRTGPVATSGYTQLVHRRCPQVYAYGYDDGVGLWSCAAGTRYEVTFYCPLEPASP